MYGSMAEIQSATTEIRRGKKKKEEEKTTGQKHALFYRAAIERPNLTNGKAIDRPNLTNENNRPIVLNMLYKCAK